MNNLFYCYYINISLCTQHRVTYCCR